MYNPFDMQGSLQLWLDWEEKYHDPITGKYKTEHIMNIILTEEQAQKLIIIIDIYIEENKEWMEQREIESLDTITNYLQKLILNLKRL